jgi:hypothetical protein
MNKNLLADKRRKLLSKLRVIHKELGKIKISLKNHRIEELVKKSKLEQKERIRVVKLILDGLKKTDVAEKTGLSIHQINEIWEEAARFYSHKSGIFGEYFGFIEGPKRSIKILRENRNDFLNALKIRGSQCPRRCRVQT